MGGYVAGGPTSDELFGHLNGRLQEEFASRSKITKAQELGLGPKAYEKLMEDQKDWERQRDSGGAFSKQSPLMQQQMSNVSLQQDLGLDDKKFKDLMKRQSEWEASVESGQPFVKQSPVMQATMAKAEPAARPGLDTGYDFVRK